MAAAPLLHPDRVDGAVHLLSAAAESLASAHWARTAHGRSAATRLAVLRAAAAVLAVRGRACASGSGPLDVWHLLPRVAPELTEWAQFFGAVLSDEARSGAPMSVREVDDLLRQGEEFVQLVAGLLGLPPVPVTGDSTVLTVLSGHGGRG
ncbi:SAV_6107 family HEPN domain-containing protein [Janibacter sp. DB-40]|uniref:SAV_6107 family HEPN domain-containing protein n=1 Tax=Janibacter sp. DB-40 TaxID=3028808 RepID=UPI002405531B|nr:SAV_6107 family HEPN domain-containing protein [Janibacter sp. DB-40]